jgi:CHAD domain-containing protein
MATAKWFPKLAPTTPLRTAARTVLAARAEGVEHFLRLVKQRPGRDPEHVHQLRVATRRLAAALSIFKLCLDRQAHRRLRRAAKQLRRAAGAARDFDVQRSLLATRFERTGTPAAAVKLCDEEMKRRRQAIEHDLKHALRRSASRLQNAIRAILAALDLEPTGSTAPLANFVTVARTTLNKRLNQLIAAGRRDLHDLDNLHQLRIAAKRLRYAMEVFASCYPREFQHELYSEVERLQEELGDINDLRNLTATLQQLQDSLRRHDRHTRGSNVIAPLADLSASVESEMVMRKTGFLQSWSEAKQKRFGRRFVNLLKAPPRRTGRPGRARRRIPQ